MNCRICGHSSKKISTQIILQKYSAAYYHCGNCDFVQTEEPYWLNEAYQSVITSLDIGLISRNEYLANTIPPIIDTGFTQAKSFLDYGGGYGIFVRMMRDRGYDFYRQDIHCENIFAKHFDIEDSSIKDFDILTAFEVFEHLPSPVEEMEKMFTLSKNLIFSTELNDKHLKNLAEWWYLAPQTGQHISFYNTRTFKHLAGHFGKHYYSNGHNLHILSEKMIPPEDLKKIFPQQKSNRLFRRIKGLFVKKDTGKRASLLPGDFEFVKKKLFGDK